MTQTRTDRIGALFVLAASLLWGSTGTAATFAPGVSPIAVGAVAMGIGGLLQAAIAVPALRRSWSRIRAQWGTVLIGAVAVAVYPLAFYSSMKLAGVAVGTVVSIGSAPVCAAVIERIVDGRRLSLRWAIAGALGIAGVALLTAVEGGGASGAAVLGSVSGILLGLLAGATYALYSWAAHRVIHTGVPARAAMGSIFGLAGLALMPVLILSGASFLASWSNAGVGLYLAVVPMFAGYVLFGMGLARVPASTATLLSLVEPVAAAVLAVLVVGEVLAPVGWLGIGLIAGSLAVLTIPFPARTAAPRRSRVLVGQDG